MEVNTILGIDPSLRGTGLCLLSVDEKLVVFDRIKYDEKIGGSFIELFARTHDIKIHLERFIEKSCPDVVASECPLPVGQFAAGLTGLDVLLFDMILTTYSMMYMFHPTYLRFVVGKGVTYNHTAYVNVAKTIIEAEKFTTSIKRFSADEAAAFLFAYRIAILHGHKPMVDIPQLQVKKEIILLGGKSWQESQQNQLQRNGLL